MRHRDGVAVLQHAAIVRYRRPLNLFTPFRLNTKLVWFDARSLYFEHRFITLHDGFVRAVALAKVPYGNFGGKWKWNHGKLRTTVDLQIRTFGSLSEYGAQLRCPRIVGEALWNRAPARMS